MEFTKYSHRHNFPEDNYIFDSGGHRIVSQSRQFPEYNFVSGSQEVMWDGNLKDQSAISPEDEVKLGGDKSLLFPFISIFSSIRKLLPSKIFTYKPDRCPDVQEFVPLLHHPYPHENSQGCTPYRIKREGVAHF